MVDSYALSEAQFYAGILVYVVCDMQIGGLISSPQVHGTYALCTCLLLYGHTNKTAVTRMYSCNCTCYSIYAQTKPDSYNVNFCRHLHVSHQSKQKYCRWL